MTKTIQERPPLPDILAPAGNRGSFLAALAAGADAVYCGLKDFSARMAAKNFDVEALADLAALARERKVKVFVAFNTMIKSSEMQPAAELLHSLTTRVEPDAIIFQDLAVVDLSRQVAYAGRLHFSTLANVSFPAALRFISENLPKSVDRVVLPRELSIDEIKAMAAACPPGKGLEVFVHGALCHAVSGRCYWSSYLGGKSGLRGRCVQPCRRRYTYQGEMKRYFSCQDLSLDVLAKVLLDVPEIRAWKIEGRKKNAHYVYYTVSAYKLLRDEGSDPRMKKAALSLLARALGRPGTHYHFLPQRPQNPVELGKPTGSGMLVGRTGGGPKPFMTPWEPLMPGDVLRVGCEDDAWHGIVRVRQSVPKKGRFYLDRKTGKAPPKGAPVFLTDRREKALLEQMANLEKAMTTESARPNDTPSPKIVFPGAERRRSRPPKGPTMMRVSRRWMRSGQKTVSGLWLSKDAVASVPANCVSRVWWWLPPVIWPDEAASWQVLVATAMDRGGRMFVLNAPWQAAFFRNRAKAVLWAGPFCNIANPMALGCLGDAGFSGAVVSPELDREAFIALPGQSPIQLGVVVSGNWPFSISRIGSEEVADGVPFSSPRNESAWTCRHGENVWIYPNWQLDLTSFQQALQDAGYTLFVHLQEPIPKGVQLKSRAGVWNWHLSLS